MINSMSKFLHRFRSHDGTMILRPTKANNDAEKVFITDDGRSIPVFRHHRYGLKKCWSVFGPVAALAELNGKGLLSGEDQQFLKAVIGHRTITEPMTTVRSRLQPYLERYHDIFLTVEIPDIGRRLLKPSQKDVEKSVEKKRREHLALIKRANLILPIPLKPKDRMLEIGYTSGGESIIGFQRLGFEAYGIDNFYYDKVKPTTRHQVVGEMAGGHAQLMVGDITSHTEFKEEYFSFIYSLSVLEHIGDMEAAFREMYRLLKPGGAMFHRYDPFFHISGAHSHATLDSPWAHMRINDAELERYIIEFRPYEADISLPWIRSALNRRHSMSNVQRALSKAGFEIMFWKTEPLAQQYLNALSPEILKECLAVNLGVTLADLTSSACLFWAVKPE